MFMPSYHSFFRESATAWEPVYVRLVTALVMVRKYVPPKAPPRRTSSGLTLGLKSGHPLKEKSPLAALEGGGATSSYTSTAVTGGMGGSLYISLLWDTSLFLYSETLRGSWGSSTPALPGLDAEALARAASFFAFLSSSMSEVQVLTSFFALLATAPEIPFPFAILPMTLPMPLPVRSASFMLALYSSAESRRSAKARLDSDESSPPASALALLYTLPKSALRAVRVRS
mmetsp:Transcript_22086/g.46127  ORF Transcript_22086/g.46127 Transcript_22086/m.46127 type:complete len:229 (+) Transcript_22086:393-1079(+)